MNILFVSSLTDKISEGPNYSVPAQIRAQAKYDNVFWWNISDARQEGWLEGGLFNGIAEYPELKISSLPAPFNSPDLVIFECFYYVKYAKLAKECKKRKIPYVIIPRSAMTKQGQKLKRLKKLVANFLIFKPFAKKAVAVQYLTKNEYNDSGKKWNKTSYIMPNGMNEMDELNKTLKPEINGAYIGRFAYYQKGLDMLFDACVELKEQMRQNKFSISLYGPERLGERADLMEKIKSSEIADLLIINEGVFGQEKAEVLKNADFFIMTSRFEGMPMALIEAMSYTLPCFVTEGTYMAEEVLEYDAGWACETNTESIKLALQKMMDEKNKLLEKGKNARALSLNYTWDKIALNTHEILSQIINK